MQMKLDGFKTLGLCRTVGATTGKHSAAEREKEGDPNRPVLPTAVEGS